MELVNLIIFASLGIAERSRLLREIPLGDDAVATSENVSGIVYSWSGLCTLLTMYADRKSLFRRQTAALPILPVIGRRSARSNELQYNGAHERTMFEEFKKRSLLHWPIEPNDDWEWLAVARHQGLPTRLVDWTESFLTAAWFATLDAGLEGGRQARAAVIYIVRDFGATKTKSSPFVPGEPRIFRSTHSTPRITAQQGVFTIHGNPTKPFSAGVESWLIAPKACAEIKFNLDSAGINYASMFPDVGGIAKHLAWLYKWDRLPQ